MDSGVGDRYALLCRQELEAPCPLLTFLAEHHVLYQVNIRNAKNVFIGLQEGESAYWQGTGNKLLAPEPWSKSLLASDPDFGWCAADSAMVRAPFLLYCSCFSS